MTVTTTTAGVKHQHRFASTITTKCLCLLYGLRVPHNLYELLGDHVSCVWRFSVHRWLRHKSQTNNETHKENENMETITILYTVQYIILL